MADGLPAGEGFQSTLPARGATGKPLSDGNRHGISIHAPRTGSDLPLITLYIHFAYFNPRSPHGERPGTTSARHTTRIFQSTLPARGATHQAAENQQDGNISIHAPRTGSDFRASRGTSEVGNFNPRSPHGERPVQGGLTDTQVVISIHAPRTGSDNAGGLYQARVHISIHAPRTGSDVIATAFALAPTDFNPRSPHGERRSRSWGTGTTSAFQSTLPARGATNHLLQDVKR